MSSNSSTRRLVAVAGGGLLVTIGLLTAGCGKGGEQAPSTTHDHDHDDDHNDTAAIERSAAISDGEGHQSHRRQLVLTADSGAACAHRTARRPPQQITTQLAAARHHRERESRAAQQEWDTNCEYRQNQSSQDGRRQWFRADRDRHLGRRLWQQRGAGALDNDHHHNNHHAVIERTAAPSDGEGRQSHRRQPVHAGGHSSCSTECPTRSASRHQWCPVGIVRDFGVRSWRSRSEHWVVPVPRRKRPPQPRRSGHRDVTGSQHVAPRPFAAVPVDERQRPRFHLQVGFAAGIGVTDLRVAVLDQQPVPPIGPDARRERSGDDHPARR